MATWDVTVDGVALNSLASQVDYIENRRQVPLPGDQNIALAGMYGEQAVLAPWGSSSFRIDMWVDGVDPVTGDGFSEAQLETNLSTVLNVFLAPIQHDVQIVQPDGTTRRCLAQLVAWNPMTDKGRAKGLSIGLKVASGQWESTTTSTQVLSGNDHDHWVRITGLAGSQGPVTDALLLLKGAITNPKIESNNDGWSTTASPYVSYAGALSSTQVWAIDSKSWLSKVGTGLTDASGGTDVIGLTDYYNSHGRLLEIAPPYYLRVTGTASWASDWSLTVITRSKFI